MRKMIFITGACAVLAACGSRAPQQTTYDDDTVYSQQAAYLSDEEEDCDAEDLREGDSDCRNHPQYLYYKNLAKKKKYGSASKPSYKTTTTKPTSSYSSKPSYSSSSSSSYSSKPSYSSSRSSYSSSRSSSGRRR